MKILYGINGTGNGHITKSAQIIKTLQQRGHEVDILVSGVNKNIQLPFKPTWTKPGFTFFYRDGKIDFLQTVKNSEIKEFVKDLRINLSGYDRICTDFEPITAWSARICGKETIGISHQYSFLSSKSPRPKNKQITAELFMKWFSPVGLPIGLHFREYDKNIFSPILRQEIVNGDIKDFGHTTVYLPSYKTEQLLDHFKKFNHDIHIFSDVKEEIRFGNVLIKPLSTERFIQSLLSCNKVVTAAGFELPSEALYLNKKLICIPIMGQYEQACNAASLSLLGVRIEKTLDDLQDLECNEINWIWKNPLSKIIDIIEHQVV